MNGLTTKEVIESRNKYGSNTLTKIKRKSFLKLVLISLSDPIIKILLIVLSIKFIFLFKDFDWYETIGILIAVVLASLISALSEYGSEEAFKTLEEESSKQLINVLRNGKVTSISSTDVVVNDIVLLNSGERIPADGYIVSGNLTVNESSINGESKEKHKKEGEYLYSSTIIYDGEARMLVKKVGDNTLIGSLAKDIQQDDEISPLKKRLTKLAKIISLFGYIGAILVAIIYLITTNDYSFDNILYTLTLSITVLVVTVPEGLPLMISLVLSSNMKKMVKDNVLVRKLIGIETSGNINCLLTDKTGTITEGKLMVTAYVTPNNKLYKAINEVPKVIKDNLLNNLYYNNSSTFNDKQETVGGNQTDKCILSFIEKKIDTHKIVDKELFNSDKKYSSVTLDNNKKYFKGAKEVLLDKCLYYLNEQGQKKIIYNKEKISKEMDNIANSGSRIIFLAFSEDPNSNNLIYMGYLIIKDTIRPTASQSIEILHKAGINVVMITGDNINTATAIAKEAKIMEDNKDIAIDSKMFNNLTDEEIIRIYPHLKVIARALPQDKKRLVTILQKENLIVGMTGDGMNDASALKKANVGFAMGSGTSVAKEASDIVILDDNIKSITKAILYGRTIFKNIRKFIIFQLTVNICAMFMAIIGPLIGVATPVTVIQMLWINMIMDTLAGIAFSHEPALKEYMTELPKSESTPIINKYMYQEIFIAGIYSSLLGLFFLKSSFVSNIIRYSADNRYLYTAYFSLFVFIGIVNAFNSRTTRLNIFANLWRNKHFIVIFSLIIIIQLYLIYYGGPLFRTYGLTFKELMFTIILALTIIPIDFIRKRLTKNRTDKI